MRRRYFLGLIAAIPLAGCAARGAEPVPPLRPEDFPIPPRLAGGTWMGLDRCPEPCLRANVYAPGGALNEDVMRRYVDRITARR